eukprot:118987-Prorocentrum_minimum.AAC.1
MTFDERRKQLLEAKEAREREEKEKEAAREEAMKPIREAEVCACVCSCAVQPSTRVAHAGGHERGEKGRTCWVYPQ